MDNNVFTRIPLDQLRMLAAHGVSGAIHELDRRMKNDCHSDTDTMIAVAPVLRKDLIEEKSSKEEVFVQYPATVLPNTVRSSVEESPLSKKTCTVPDALLQPNPTIEQENILNATGRIVKINARAGTGKTATLLMIAQQNTDKKIIYLVFNDRNRQEAKSKFPSNVTIHTIHSFTRSIAGCTFNKHLVIRPSLFFNQFVSKKEILATLTNNFIVFFLNSTYSKPIDAIESFNKKLSSELTKIFAQSQTRILEVSRDKLNSWYKDAANCPHDFYLKMSHLEKRFQGRLSRYDLVLIDEGQDLSPIMIDVLSTFRGKIIVVGDSHQQIYSFRYAEDAMQNFVHDEMLDLTMSFRFGEKIATLISKFIKCSKEDHDFKLIGNPAIQSQVHFYDGHNVIEYQPNTAILSRTNFSLFKNALSLKARKHIFCFGRDISAELKKTLDVYWLFINEKSKIRDDLIMSFRSTEKLEEYAKAINDYQLIKMLELVKVYKNEFPGTLFEFLKLCSADKAKYDHKAIILSTIHAAKGQEYEHVVIDDDVIPRLDVSNNKGSYNYFEEVNIVYVGMTRAQKNLYLPAGMKKLFDDEWQYYTNRIHEVIPRHINKKRIVHNMPAVKRRKKGYGPYVKDMHRGKKNDSANTTQDLRQGDTVRTLSGYGQIVKIDGDQCLVALKNQKARVWERRSTLVKVKR